MKAWIVSDGGDWVTLMHADTRGKAKQLAREYVDDWNEFIDMRAKRFSEMDDKPFTYTDCRDNGFEYYDGGEELLGESEFVNDCPCIMCKEHRNKTIIVHF